MANFTYDLLLIFVVVLCMLTDFRLGVLYATVRIGALAMAIWNLPILVPLVAPQLAVLGTMAGITATVLILATFHFAGNQFAHLLFSPKPVVTKTHALSGLALGFVRGNVYGLLLILSTIVIPTEHGKNFWRAGFFAPYYQNIPHNITRNDWFPNINKTLLYLTYFTQQQQALLSDHPLLTTPTEQQPTAHNYTQQHNEILDLIRAHDLSKTIANTPAAAEHYAVPTSTNGRTRIVGTGSLLTVAKYLPSNQTQRLIV